MSVLARPVTTRVRSAGHALAAVCPSSAVLTPALRAAVRLTPSEVERHRRTASPAARRDYLAGRILARLVLARRTDRHPCEVSLSQRCGECGADDHGRPTTEPRAPAVSWSHAEGVVAAIAGPGPVGIDIELVASERVSDPLIERVLGGEESRVVRASEDPTKAFLARWTARESLVKAGVGRLIGAYDEQELAGSRDLVLRAFECDEAPDLVGACVSAGATRFAEVRDLCVQAGVR